MCCGEAGEKEKESARGTMDSSHRPPRAIYFFDWGYPAGASAEERAKRLTKRFGTFCFSPPSERAHGTELHVLTIDFVYALHFRLIVKIFPQEATAYKNSKQNKKNDEKIVIIKQTRRFFRVLLLGNFAG